MNKKTSYIIIFSLLVVLTVGIIFTDYVKQLGTILADASVPNPGHSLSEIEGGQDLATKEYIDSAMTGAVKTSGDQTIGGIKTFSNAIIGTGIITNASGGTRPTCDASTRGLMWYEYGSSEQDDILYVCQKFSNGTYSFTSISDWVCGDNFIDHRDSNIYPTIQIGNQCWMAKNLAYLPSVIGSGTGSITTPYYYVYGYDGTDVSAAKATTNYTIYGVLYNWPAATTACPSGWHLPTNAELTALTNITGESKEGLIYAGWFKNLFAGMRGTGEVFGGLDSNTCFWSSSKTGFEDAYGRPALHASGSTVYVHVSNRAVGYSTRCLRD